MDVPNATGSLLASAERMAIVTFYDTLAAIESMAARPGSASWRPLRHTILDRLSEESAGRCLNEALAISRRLDSDDSGRRGAPPSLWREMGASSPTAFLAGSRQVLVARRGARTTFTPMQTIPREGYGSLGERASSVVDTADAVIGHALVDAANRCTVWSAKKRKRLDLPPVPHFEETASTSQ